MSQPPDTAPRTDLHTPEPWRTITIDGHPCVMQDESAAEIFHGDPDPRFIGSICCESPSGWDEYDAANARRIVACVNACRGIPTDAIEAGVIGELVEAMRDILQKFTYDQHDKPAMYAEQEARAVLAKLDRPPA